MKSLSRHLTISLTISLFVFSSVLVFIVGHEIREHAEKNLINRLKDDTQGILRSFIEQPISFDAEQLQYLPEMFTRPFSGHYFQIVQDDKIMRSRSLWDVELPALAAGIHRKVQGPGQQQLLAFCENYVVRGKHITLCLAEDTSELEVITRYIQQRMISLSLFGLLLLLLVQIWAIRRALRPLSMVRQELHQLERGEITELQQQVPAEISQLVQEVNHLLIVLQQRLQRSRNAMGNLSHALKTPLTIIFQILERRQNDQDNLALLQQAKNIQSHINRELSRARTAGQLPGGHWPNPALDMRDLVSTLAAVYRQRVHIHLHMDEIQQIPADREDMMELLGNLIDNACKWAVQRVDVCLSVDDTGLHILIEDDGPGMDEQAMLLVQGRGVRLDEAKQGHGLGLSIVGDIVEAYHGTLLLSRSQELGGLQVNIDLRLKQSSPASYL